MSSLDSLEAMIPHRDRASADVSKWSIGMQIQHSLIATANILKSMSESEPGAETPKFSLPRFFVMTFGRLPRGKGKAPEVSHPEPSPSEETLREVLARARAAQETAKQADPACYWRHFVFGVLPRDQALKFVEIHNRHHLRIIDDILAKS